GQLLHGPRRFDQQRRRFRCQRFRGSRGHGSHQQARRRHWLDQRTQGVSAPDGRRSETAELDSGRVSQQGSYDPVSDSHPIVKEGRRMFAPLFFEIVHYVSGGSTSLSTLRFFHYSCERIIVRSILKRVSAFNACGWLAGMSTALPAFVTNGLPETVISASPSSTCAKASNGAVCSLKPCPSSKANSVIVAAGRFMSVRMTTAPSW